MRRPSIARPGPVTAVLATLVAPLGVLAFGWSTTAVLGVYVLDVIALVWWSAVKVPFAAKRPNNMIEGRSRLFGPLQQKRGETALPGPLPPVYLRNVPVLVATVAVLGPMEVAAAVGAFTLTEPTVTEPLVGQLLVGGLVVFVGRGVETVTEYFLGGGYRDHSPRSVMLAPFGQLFAVGGLVIAASLLSGSGVASQAVFALVVGGKLLVDLRTLQVDRSDETRGWFYRLYGSAETEIDPVPVAVPDGDPVVRARPSRLVAVVDAVWRGVAYSLTSPVLVVYAVALFLVGIGALSLGLVAAAVAAAVIAVRATVRYLAVGTVEYRGYDGVVVVYDRLLGGPQARIERTGVTGVTLERDPVDRLFRTHTVAVDGTADGDSRSDIKFTVPDPEAVDAADDANANESLSLVHVDDPDPLVDALGVAWQVEQ